MRSAKRWEPMPTPPEIEKPFATPDERRAAHAEFIRLGELVQQINSLPDEVPSPAWLAAQLDAPLLGIQESVPDRLKRFRELFTDEMAAVGEAVDSERHRALDDASLRAALYLARRLLASLIDCPIAELRDRLAGG